MGHVSSKGRHITEHVGLEGLQEKAVTETHTGHVCSKGCHITEHVDLEGRQEKAVTETHTGHVYGKGHHITTENLDRGSWPLPSQQRGK